MDVWRDLRPDRSYKMAFMNGNRVECREHGYSCDAAAQKQKAEKDGDGVTACAGNHDCSRCPIDLSEFQGRTDEHCGIASPLSRSRVRIGCGCLRRHSSACASTEQDCLAQPPRRSRRPEFAHYIWYQRFSAIWEPQWVPGFRPIFSRTASSARKPTWCNRSKVGSIDIMLTGSSIWATVAPEFGMLDLGYVFDSYAHMARALDGGVGASLAEILRSRTGCTIMGWGSHFAARSVYTKAPVNSIAELKGVKLRVLPTSAFIDTFKLMGAVPTPIPFIQWNLVHRGADGVVDGFRT